jgi:hypothetical protein
MDKAFFDALDRAIAAASRHEKELLGYAGVLSVGAGPERKGGKITGAAAIVVTVRTKQNTRELAARGAKLLPETIDNVPVDVVEQGKPVEAPEIVEAMSKARQVLERVKDKWLKTENVTGIGIGYKYVKGKPDFTKVVLAIAVEKKFPLDEVRKRKLTEIPSEIDGVATDVDEMPRMRPAASASGSRDDRKDPLVGGLTVGVNTKPFWYGTLGAIVFDRSTGEQMVLSNQHVLDGPAGTEVVQPSPIGLDDSLDIGFQLDICNPAHFFRLDTPNTTVGSVLAGAAVAVAIAAAESDVIDPTRRGQDATPPPSGAKTLLESHQVKLDYPVLPTPGTHFKVDIAWKYTRHTDVGDFSHSVVEVKENPHALVDKLLITDRKIYYPGDTIRLFGLILPETCAPQPSERNPGRPLTTADIATLTRWTDVTPTTLSKGVWGQSHAAAAAPAATAAAASEHRCRCDRFQLTALLTPTTVDRAYPVVLREPLSKYRSDLLTELIALVSALGDKQLLERVFRLVRYGCLYTGELAVGGIPKGPWKHYLYVQTVNYVPAGVNPLDAATIIGGLPVSQNTRPEVGIACGPIVWEDGQFSIELI